MTQQILLRAARKIYNDHVKEKFQSDMDQNIWRATWALDTLIDYFSVIDSSDATGFVTSLARGKILNATNGAWWDDYGWDGIASLRAAESVQLDHETEAALIQNAINCWCYMKGPGWQKNDSGVASGFNVPYPDIFKWQDLIAQKEGDIGAPNVFNYWESTECPSYWLDLQPRHTPGGIWNAPDKPKCPFPGLPQCGAEQELAGIQNTVTNAVFTILSLRLFKLSHNPQYQDYFSCRNIDTLAIGMALKNQIQWFQKWFHLEKAESSLLYDISRSLPGTSVLIRERAPRMHNGMWSAGYCDTLAWTGDQGLMVGAMREAQQFRRENPSAEDLIEPISDEFFKAIVNGVTQASWSAQGYNMAKPVLRPWVQYNNLNKAGEYTSFPAGDAYDYQTGIAVFCRYVQQAVQAGFNPGAELRSNIANLAGLICDGHFSKPDFLECDGLFPQQSDGPDGMTAWINQLSVLALAVTLGD